MVYLFLATAVWHSLAVYFFLIQPSRTLRSFTIEEPISPVTTDIMRFLGAINAGYVVLAIWSAYQTPTLPMLNLVLCIANGSQFFIDILAHQRIVWRKKLLGITIADGFFMVTHGFTFLYLTQ